MQPVVPSQVVEYIDSMYPQAKQQFDGSGKSFYLERDHAPNIRHILTMIENIPSHLLVLDGESHAEFGEAIAALSVALDSWSAGDNVHQLKKVPGRSKAHPLALLRKTLPNLSDTGITPSTAGLEFVEDVGLRSSLRRDLSAANEALATGNWKAATVLAGSVVEALLLEVLATRKQDDPSNVEKALSDLQAEGVLGRTPSSNLDEWNLHQLAETAGKLRIIQLYTLAQCRLAKDFRNLVHPGRQRRLSQECNRATALSAVTAVEHVIQDLVRSGTA